VHASVDVAVGSATIVYVCVPVVIAVPPVVKVTATVYVATAPATAVNVNDDAIVPAAGVVSVAVDVSVKSEKYDVPTGCTVIVHTMFTELWITGVVHASEDVATGNSTIV